MMGTRVITRQQKASLFARFASWISHATGLPATFIMAVLVIVGWGVTGPFFGFSDTWQLVINTGTTIITFLMVFIIQNTQNRESAAMQLKLDEIIRSLENANNALLNMEELDEKELEEIRAGYLKLAEEARNTLRKARSQRAATPREGRDEGPGAPPPSTAMK